LFGFQVKLVLEEQVVHLPELVLARPRRLGGLGRELGVRMHFQQRENAGTRSARGPEALEQDFHGGI